MRNQRLEQLLILFSLNLKNILFQNFKLHDLDCKFLTDKTFFDPLREYPCNSNYTTKVKILRMRTGYWISVHTHSFLYNRMISTNVEQEKYHSIKSPYKILFDTTSNDLRTIQMNFQKIKIFLIVLTYK